MTTSPDSQAVREIARKHLTDFLRLYPNADAYFVGSLVLEAVGDPDLWRTDEVAYFAWCNAVVAEIRTAVPSWPAEQDGNVRTPLADVLTELGMTEADLVKGHTDSEARVRAYLYAWDSFLPGTLVLAEGPRPEDIRLHAVDLRAVLARSAEQEAENARLQEELKAAEGNHLNLSACMALMLHRFGYDGQVMFHEGDIRRAVEWLSSIKDASQQPEGDGEANDG